MDFSSLWNIVGVALCLGFAIRNPASAFAAAGIVVLFTIFGAAALGKTWLERLKLIPIHFLVVLFFCAGVLFGLALKVRLPKRRR